MPSPALTGKHFYPQATFPETNEKNGWRNKYGGGQGVSVKSIQVQDAVELKNGPAVNKLVTNVIQDI